MTAPTSDRATEFAALAAEDRVAARLYTDPEIFDWEMEKIFYSTWVWVAHESEIPDAGSFKMCSHRPAAGDRQPRPEGKLQCPPEPVPAPGSQRLRSTQGQSQRLHLPLPLLVVLPRRATCAASRIPTATRALPRSATCPCSGCAWKAYNGLIFASFKTDIEPLADFLGDAKLWIDRFMKQGAGFPVKVQGEHKFRFDGNWKIQLENTTDGYHFPIVHRSWMASVDAETADMLSFMTDEEAVTHALGNGHSVAIMVPEHVDLEDDDGTEELQERFRPIIDELSETMPPEQVRRIVRSMHGAGYNLNLFPNLSLSMSFFRVLRPISVERNRDPAHGAGPGRRTGERQPGTAAHPRTLPGTVRVRHLRRFGGVGPGPARSRSQPRDADPGQPRAGPGGGRREGWKTSHVTDETGMRESYAMWKRMMNDDH